MPRATGQVERVLDGLTVGLLTDKAARDRQLEHSAGREIEQQVRCLIQGELGNAWSHVDREVFWPYPFIWAPAQRGVPYKTPHFSYGIEMRTGTQALVVVHAHILKWVVNDSSLVEGATIRFAASAPTSTSAHAFSAVAHLTFQGYAAETEEGEEA